MLKFRRWSVAAILAVALTAGGSSASLAGSDGAFWRSLLLPGAGQAHDGRYSRAALFAGGAVVSGAGLLFSQIHYDRAVEKFEDRKKTYQGYQSQLNGGTEIPLSDIQQTYTEMNDAFDSADTRLMWRNVFLGAFLTTYALNILDVMTQDPVTGEISDPMVSLEASPTSFRLVKTIRF